MLSRARGWRVAAQVLAVVGLGACGDGALQGMRARFVAEPGELSFGPTALGRARTLELQLRNQGRGPLSVFELTTSTAGIAIAPAEPFELGAGESRAIQVTFDPLLEGEVSGALRIATDDATAGPEGVVLVPLSGLGVKAFASVSPRRLDFGNVELGTVRILQLMLENPFPAEVAFELSFEGEDAGMFGSSDAGRPVLLRPMETRAVPISFRPDRLFAIAATARVKVCEMCQPEEVELLGFGINSFVDVQPGRIDFGRVGLGSLAEERLTVTNLGNQALDFGGFEWKAPQTTFSFDPVAPRTLTPGERVETTVRFSPTQHGPIPRGLLRILVQARNSVAGSYPMIAVTGEVGSSCVVVLPRALDFGFVPEGMSGTRSVDLINRCGGPVEITDLTLTTEQGGFFGLVNAAAFPLAAGEIHPVRITFTPKPASGTSAGSFAFKVIQGQAITRERVSLSGTTGALPPCQYTLVPNALDFGQVPVGAAVSLSLSVRNDGAEQCFLSSFQLASGSDPEFSAPPLPSAIIDPGQAALLEVVFRPTRVGTFSALGEAWLNHPTAGHPTALITGKGVQGCFQLQPATVSFGTSRITCGTRTRSVTAINTCSASVTLTGAAIVSATSPELGLSSAPSFPFTLAPGAQTGFTVAYTPVDDGLDSAALWVEAGAGNGYSAGLKGRGVSDPNHTDRFVQQNQSQVDLLFVIDNSGSMMEEQQNLAQNFAALMSAAQAAGVDYHIAVTTTGLEPSPGGWSACPGGAEGGENGRLFPVDGSSPRIITPTTPNASQVFARNVQVGWCHWNEQGLEAMYRALSPPLVNSPDDPSTSLLNDGNGGFLREQARLAIVVVTDEEDFSTRPPSFYVTFLKALKHGDPSMLSFSAIVGPKDLTTCPTASSTGSRYLEVAQATGGISESICTQNWAASLQALSSNAFGPRRSFPLSETPANPAQISVTVDGQPVTSGWTYDPVTRTVVFDAAAAPPAGALVEITYPLGC